MYLSYKTTQIRKSLTNLDKTVEIWKELSKADEIVTNLIMQLNSSDRKNLPLIENYKKIMLWFSLPLRQEHNERWKTRFPMTITEKNQNETVIFIVFVDQLGVVCLHGTRTSIFRGKPWYFVHGFITNRHNDRLQIGFLVQLVEHCTSIAEVMDLNTAQAWIFIRSYFHYCQSSYCKDCCHIHFYLHFFYILKILGISHN